MDEHEALSRDLARLGPFFALADPDADPGPASEWRPFAELTTPGPLASLVARTRRQLAESAGVAIDAVETRAAASIAMMSWTARLVSPALGSAVLHGRVPRLARSVWRAESAFAVALAPAAFASVGPSVEDMVAEMEPAVVVPLRAVAGAVADAFAVSPTVLTGNIASSVNGAAIVLTGQRPDLAGRTNLIVDALFEQSLPGTGGYETTLRGGRQFRRASCCLFYRLPRGGYCGDCILRPAS